MELTDIKGLGKKRAEKLRAVNIHTPHELINTFPKRYIHRYISTLDEANEAMPCYIEAKVSTNPKVFFIRKNLSRLTFTVMHETQNMTVSIFNQHYLKQHLRPHVDVVLYGKINQNKTSFTAQKVYLKAHFEVGFMPVYKIEGFTDKTFYNLVQNALQLYQSFKDYLPDTLLKKYKLFHRNELMKHVHKPKNKTIHHQLMRRLKFEELFLFQLRMQHQKKLRQRPIPPIAKHPFEVLNPYIKGLHFTLTNDQQTVLKDIIADLRGSTTMFRLLQGDTGSGKTIVAFLAACYVMMHGKQVAMMAPTEILAKQHFQTFLKHFSNTDFKAVYVSQSLSNEQLNKTTRAIKHHQVDLVIGTHKLYSQNMEYHDLAFIITDEQHRFGVNQRRQLTQKAQQAHRLHLSATPIPRTLAQSLYGDMDVSSITTRPVQTTKVSTMTYSFKEEAKVIKSMQETMEKNQQIFIVSPVINTSERYQYSVHALMQFYQEKLPNSNIDMLHGQLSQEAQDEVLKRFKNNDIQVLIATTIIEVGIDFPNATMMVIYHADRFGFAQLHQLRGRVGRGDANAYCICLYDPQNGPSKRLEQFRRTNDGFALSEFDLTERGHGDLIGTLQSGYIDFNYADITKDMNILEVAKSEAKLYAPKVFNNSDNTYALLRKRTDQYFNSN